MTIDSAHLRFAPAAPVTAPSRAATPPSITEPVAPMAAPASVRPVADTIEVDIPSAPPRDVLQAMAAAAKRVAELAENNRELHFRADEHSSRIIIEVRDMAGNVIRTIPPSKALNVLSTQEPGKERSWVA